MKRENKNSKTKNQRELYVNNVYEIIFYLGRIFGLKLESDGLNPGNFRISILDNPDLEFLEGDEDHMVKASKSRSEFRL